ncbi:hypothetical protein GCM10022289_31240 [Pedobacter jeongneungensis]|uniref:Uncharacterized protein n=1 Tax=Pedobacter jeongneungensis TaxID=947309 RepID=A0ABP8BJ02_9SPHI
MASSCKSDGNNEREQVKKKSEDLTDTNMANKTKAPQLDTTTVDMEKVKKDLDWADIKLKFISECLNPFLKARKVTTNCSDCDKISFSYTLTSNENGEVINVRRESETIQCKKLSSNDITALHDAIEIYLKKQVLPKSFGKGSYTGQLGFILKC